MNLQSTLLAAALLLTPLAMPVARADDSKDSMLQAVALDAGKISNSEKKLYEQSIASTKESIARETLDVFYRDALDYYRQAQYDRALELLDKIYSIDPYYEDVGRMRETITRLRSNQDFASKRGVLTDYMRKGNAAHAAGQNVQAIGFWKQALTVNPSYEPAKKKIQDVNHVLAQKQYEAGYLYYHHGDNEEALDSWSNAIAIDPSFKQHGLLLLMSKVQLSMRRAKISQLTTQANEQYSQSEFSAALQTCEELIDLDPRNEPARRLAAKVRIQLGQVAFKSARESLNQRLFTQAIKQWQEAIKYGYEVQRSQKGIQEAEEMVQSQKEARQAKRNPKPEPAAEQPAQTAPVAAVPPPIINAEEATKHYRQGMSAIRVKDYHRALEELDIAAQLNSTDEHIYVARERARQEWAAMNAGH